MAAIIYGCGTGRSGTHSLCQLLNQQPHTLVFHELDPDRMAWEGAESTVLDLLNFYQRSLETRTPVRELKAYPRGRRELESFQGPLNRIGELAFYYLPYVPLLFKKDPRIQVVCLERDEEATVQSYLKKTYTVRKQKILGPITFRRTIDRNHWVIHQGKIWTRDPRWDSCYPKYDCSTKEEALHRYWQDYHRQSLALEQEYPGRFKVFPLEALNTEEGQREILDWIGIPTAEHRYRVGIQTNRTPA
ncbi:MAG: hypothetical protein D6762_07755 [Candidatus Neomarinimicrobiota bacterium]|nr:MAG: hypothetical protein D6762_07755 [Candidatus Neomarinimicrobiota bacterium]